MATGKITRGEFAQLLLATEVVEAMGNSSVGEDYDQLVAQALDALARARELVEQRRDHGDGWDGWSDIFGGISVAHLFATNPAVGGMRDLDEVRANLDRIDAICNRLPDDHVAKEYIETENARRGLESWESSIATSGLARLVMAMSFIQYADREVGA